MSRFLRSSLKTVSHLPSQAVIFSRRNCSRALSTSAHSWVRSNSRVSTVFGVLVSLGVVSTAYGLYEFYTAFTLWPEEVRGDLRAGIKTKHQGDLFTSERFLRRAWQTASDLPVERLGSDRQLKLSGIAIALAEVLEAQEKPREAYDVYVEALAALQAASARSPAERMRAVVLASRLGEMAEMYQQPAAEEERWLTFAVDELLRVVRDQQDAESLRIDNSDAKPPIMLSDLELSDWANRTDVSSPLEALGRFYSRQGNVEYAIPLYLQAINMLVPPASSRKQSSTEEKCRGAELMNNLAELLVRDAPTPEQRHRAETWARQALGTIERTKASSKNKPDELVSCEHALAAVLFNLGSLREMSNDFDGSRHFYQASWDQSRQIKMKEGIVESQAALRRLERAQRNSPTATPQ